MEEYKIINWLIQIAEKTEIVTWLIDKTKIIIDDKLIELRKLKNVFGNFDTFINNQEIEGGDLWVISNFSKFDKIINPNSIISKWCIIGKLGYFNFIKTYFKYVWKYFYKRKDLNIVHRTYMSFKKANQNVCRFKIGIDVNKYFNEKTKFDKQIKELFDDKNIDRIYIYSYKEIEQP